MDKSVRINKFLAQAGVSSRRGSDRLIEEGRVTLNGKPAFLGETVFPGDVVELDGCVVNPGDSETVILAFNKPKGITCTADRGDPSNIIDFLNYPKRIFYAGRLDKDSEGLVILTNDGDVANRITRSRYEHEKEYVVTVDRDITDEFVQHMEKGVNIGDGEITRPCNVYPESKRRFRIILRQGLNRQIRRMCEALGYGVTELVRVRIMNVKLGKQDSGSYRQLGRAERKELLDALKNSELAPRDDSGRKFKNRKS